MNILTIYLIGFVLITAVSVLAVVLSRKAIDASPFKEQDSGIPLFVFVLAFGVGSWLLGIVLLLTGVAHF